MLQWMFRRVGLVLVALWITGCGNQPEPRSPASSEAQAVVSASNQIIGPRVAGTAKELRARGEHALLEQKWQEAVDAFEALVAGEPSAARDPGVIYDLALSYEGVGDREKARVRYREVARTYPTDPNARSALAREVSLDAYLEDWTALGDAGETILARPACRGGASEGGCTEPADKMLGYGARGLARITSGDEAGAAKDVNAGMDIVDETGFGKTGQLPVAAAMLKYAEGEIRKAKSEKIVLNPPPPDFVTKLEMRCALLLEAQSYYADAIRSVDLHWAAMSGFRVGEMYRTLHRHLMMIPPTDKAKTESDRQLFYGIMHVRYRALLDKGIEMMKRTISLGQKPEMQGVATAWMKRAEAAKEEMEKALVEEKEILKALPYTEETLEKTLLIMKKKVVEDEEKKLKGGK